MHKDIEPELLRVIHELVSSGNATQAAQVLGVSPSTISYKLKKARTITGAHLFIRTRSGMKPDAVAKELSSRYQSIMNTQSHTQNSRDAVTITAQSHIELVLSHAHDELVESTAPMRFNFTPSPGSTVERIESLKNGNVDLDIGSRLSGDSLIGQIKLFSSGYSVLVNRDSTANQLTLEDWNQGNHAVYSGQSGYYCNDAEASIAARKYVDKRKASLTSANIISMAAHCANSDCMMLMPDYCVPALTNIFHLKPLSLPSELGIGQDTYLNFNKAMMNDENIADVLGGVIKSLKHSNRANSVHTLDG